MPFGEEITPDGTHRKADLKYNFGDNIRQKFTGYQKDEETQLDFAEARMYENRLGRFTAVDPLLASGKSANPQTFNRYIYVGNNPLVFTDPSGLIWYFNQRENRYDWWDEEKQRFFYSDATLNADWAKVSQFRYYAGEHFGWVGLDKYSEQYFPFYETEEEVLGETAAEASTDWQVLELLDQATDLAGLAGILKGTVKRGVKEITEVVAEQALKNGSGKLTRAEVVDAIKDQAGRPLSRMSINQIVGAVGEEVAERMLRDAGYNIIESRVAVRIAFDDGTEGVRFIDRLVEKNGVYSAVEIKTGNASRTSYQFDADRILQTRGGSLVSRKPGVPENMRGTTVVWQTIQMNVLP